MIALIPRVPQRLAYALSRLAQGLSAAVPSGKNMSDTVKLLALMVRFVVVDVTGSTKCTVRDWSHFDAESEIDTCGPSDTRRPEAVRDA